MDRRNAIISAGAFALAGGLSRAQAKGAAADPLSGDSMMADVRSYVNFGIHHAGGRADLKVTDWQNAYWRRLGYKVERQRFEIPNSDTTMARLELASGEKLDGFAQPPLAFTPKGGLSAPLVTWAPGAAVSGKIALVLPGQNVNQARAAGAAAIVQVAQTPSGEIVANNTDPKAPATIPYFMLPQRLAAKLGAASGSNVRLRVEGKGGMRPAWNTIATSGEAGKWVIISTPQSGWFTCGGERGPGIAISRALSAWAKTRGLPVRILFISTSGHEWQYAGAEAFQERPPPKPEDTLLWLHLGAGFGARNYDGKTPQNIANANRTLMVTPNLLAATRSAFAGQPQVGDPPVSNIQTAAGELVNILNHGYRSAAGFWGTHGLFHTPVDGADATTPAIMEQLARSCAKLIEQAVA